MKWVLIIAFLVIAAGAASFRFLVRAWKSSNLFDREYRFPVVDDVALRLGGEKSGGCMTTVDFSGRNQS